MSDDFELDTDDLQRRMDGAMANLKTEFASLRTGRASASMLEPVMVDAYGSMTPINQVGTVNVPEPRMVTVNVWDKSLVGKVEKATLNRNFRDEEPPWDFSDIFRWGLLDTLVNQCNDTPLDGVNVGRNMH